MAPLIQPGSRPPIPPGYDNNELHHEEQKTKVGHSFKSFWYFFHDIFISYLNYHDYQLVKRLETHSTPVDDTSTNL